MALACHQDEPCIRGHIQTAYAAINYDIKKEGGLEQVYSPITLLTIMQAEGDLLIGLFEKHGHLGHLKEADEVFKKAISLINFIKTSLEQPGSRLALQDNFYQIYEKAILVKYRLKELTSQKQYWQEAFDIAEQSNAILLMEAIQSVEAEQFAGLPDSLLQLERQYKTELSFLERRRYEEEIKNKSNDPKALQQINDRIFEIHAKQHQLAANFKKNHEEYFQLKYESAIISIEKIQGELLRPDQTMVAYFVGENKLFVFVISKDQFEVVQIEKDFPLEVWVEEFRNSIYRFNPAEKESAYLNQKIANIGHELYQLILSR